MATRDIFEDESIKAALIQRQGSIDSFSRASALRCCFCASLVKARLRRAWWFSGLCWRAKL